MVNSPRHKLTWSKAPGELTIEDLQDGCCGGHQGYRSKLVLAILNVHVTTKFFSIPLTIQKMRFEDFQELAAILDFGTEQF